MSKKARTTLLVTLAVLGLLVFAIALTRAHVGLKSPHAPLPSSATFDPALRAAIEWKTAGGDEQPRTVEAAVHFSLRQTGARLHPGLGHPTNLSFGAAVRAANCIEYAHFFARVFTMAAEKNKLPARVYVVHSNRADVFGMVVPLPGLRDHDWVIVVDETPGEKRTWYVDPMFDDAWLGWDLRENVEGEVNAPAR